MNELEKRAQAHNKKKDGLSPFCSLSEAGYKSGDRYYGGLPADPEYRPEKEPLYWKEISQYFLDTVSEYPEYFIIGRSPSTILLRTPDGKETIDLYKFNACSDAEEAVEMASHYFNDSLVESKKKKRKKSFDNINTSAGNVEYNVAMFNKMNSPIDAPINNPISGPFGGDVSGSATSGGEGAGMGESLNRNIDHDNAQWGVHRFSTNNIIFRGTEQECIKFIDDHDWLWDDAEVYFMTPDDPHYINESTDKKIPEMIDLEYENITVTVYGDKRDVDDWDEWEVLTEWTYKVSRDDIEVYIIENLLNETDIPNIADISDEEVDKFVTENFDSLFAKYEDKIKDYYYDDAVEDAQERYEYEPDYPDYDSYDEYDLYEELHPRIKKNSVLEEDRADDDFDLFLRGV